MTHPGPGMPLVNDWIDNHDGTASEVKMAWNGHSTTGDEPCTENGYGNLPATYRGTISKTKTGFTCQKWTSQTPNEHNRTPENFPGQGLGDHNYCRNPDGEVKGAWCYVDDVQGPRWDYCSCGKYTRFIFFK